MKLAAISKRGIVRDFWDLHEILRSGVTLAQALEAYRRRFRTAHSDLYHVLRSLTYFADAERARVRPKGLTAAKWRAIKEFFRSAAPALLGAS